MKKMLLLALGCLLSAGLHAGPDVQESPSLLGKQAGEVIKILKDAAANIKSMSPEPTPTYCKSIPVTTTIDNQPDPDGMNELIKKVSPVFRLHPGEKAGPINPTELVASEHTSIMFKPNKGPARVVVPAGQVTMQKVWETIQNVQKFSDGMIYFNNPACVLFGSNPANYTNKAGKLTVPIYALLFNCGSDICINYITFYGLNSPYEIKEPLTGKTLLPGGGINKGAIPDQNYHRADAEHVTVVLDGGTRQIKKIYYGSHGRHEGLWLPADHPDIEFVGGTHPVFYVAKGGHGLYPMKGIGNKKTIRNGRYIRIFGAADDEVSKDGVEWDPQIIRTYLSSDKNFDPALMAATAWGANLKQGDSAQYSEDGVQGTESQDWFGNSDTKDTEVGRSYDNAPFCADDECKCLYASEVIKDLSCISTFKKRLDAKIPD